MARKIDLSKPLSAEDRAYLLTRHPVSYVDRLQELAGGAEEAPETDEEPEGGESTQGAEEAPENGGEDLIGTPGGTFDPGEHTADEVVKHLKDASEQEKARVLALEADGKGRSTILNA